MRPLRRLKPICLVRGGGFRPIGAARVSIRAPYYCGSAALTDVDRWLGIPAALPPAPLLHSRLVFSNAAKCD